MLIFARTTHEIVLSSMGGDLGSYNIFDDQDKAKIAVLGEVVVQASKLDNYPIVKTEALLTTLEDSQTFTKLDMSQAYQKLLLNDESKLYTPRSTVVMTQESSHAIEWLV